MKNHNDIYSAGGSSEGSQWNRHGHRSYSIHNSKNRNDSAEDRASKGNESNNNRSKSTDRHLSRKQRQRKKTRKILLTVFLLGVACYAVYCAIIALQGFMEHKAISSEDISFRSILSRNEPAMEFAADAEDTPADQNRVSDIQDFIDRTQKSKSVEKDIQNLVDKGLAPQAIKRAEDSSGFLIKSSSLIETLAAAHMMTGEHSDAIKNYLSILEREPDNPQARTKLAAALLGAERFEDAVAAAHWAIEVAPNSKEAHTIAADSYMKLDAPDKAIEQYETIIENNPGDFKIRSKLAFAYYESGEYGRAVRYLERMVDRNTDNSLAYYNLAVCCAEQNLTEKVVETLMRAERKFGQAFVRAWIQGDAFKALRDEPKFMLFTDTLAKAPGVTNMKSRGDRKQSVSAELGTSPFQLDTVTDRLINRDR